MTRLILFDIDLTLLRTDGAGRAAMDVVFQRLHGISDASAGIRFDGRTDRAIFTEVIERHEVGDGSLETSLAEYVGAYLDELPRQMVSRGGKTLPGVPELLAALSDHVPGFGLATGNFRQAAAAKLGHFKMWELFAGGGFGDHHSVRAELVADGIAELAAALGVDPDPGNTIVLGDTPLDVDAAHGAGAKAFGVGTGRFNAGALLASGADYALEDLSDTKQVLEILLG